MVCVCAGRQMGVALPDVVLGSSFSMAGKVAGIPDKRRRATLSMQACDGVRARCGIAWQNNAFRHTRAPRMHNGDTVGDEDENITNRLSGYHPVLQNSKSAGFSTQLPFQMAIMSSSCLSLTGSSSAPFRARPRTALSSSSPPLSQQARRFPSTDAPLQIRLRCKSSR